MPILRLPILALVALSLWLLPAAQGQTGVVRANGMPVPGATVRATRGDTVLVTVTDDNGRYRLDGMTPGPWVLEVEMFRFATARKEVTVNGPGSLEWDLTLKPLSAPATGMGRVLPPPQDASARPSATSGGRPAWQGRSQGGPGASAGSQGRGRQQNIPELTNQIEGDASSTAAVGATELPMGVQSDSANESFLVSGTLSRGLQQVSSDPGVDMGSPFGRPGAMLGEDPNNPNANGSQGQGAPGGPGMGGPGGGPGGGFGGGAGGGGFGGGRFGGGGGFGGGGFGGRGPGGRMGQGGPRGPGMTDSGLIGNRRNRGQQGLHGMINIGLFDSAFDARPFAVSGQPIDKPSYSKQRLSIQIGGPLMIPKLFRLQNTTFAFNYTVNRADNLSSQVGSVPTVLERSGDFSQSNHAVYDPSTQSPFPGNVIPVSQINPIALGLLSYVPLPNQTGSCAAGRVAACAAQNYQFTTTVPNNNRNLGLRLGQSIGRKDRLSLNFQMQNRSAVTPQTFGYLDNTDGSGYNAGLTWIHTFAPRVFNIANVVFNRNSTNLLPFFANTPDVAATLGILGTSSNPLNYGPPNLNFTNYAALSDGSYSQTHIQSVTTTEAFHWMRGNETLTFGGQFQRSQNNLVSDANGRGTYSFTGLATSGFDAGGQPMRNTGYDFADFLLGLPNSSSIRYGDTSTYFRATNYAFFGQDDWRMRPNLTINFGLRYEYFGVPAEKYGHEANLDIAPGFTAVVPVVANASGPYSGAFPASLVNPDRNNFAPRLGIAWRPWKDGKTVVRTGYGWYYNGGAYNGFARNLAAQPPFANTNSIITSSQAELTLADGFILTPPGKTVTNSWAIDRFYRVPYAQSWNLSIQQDLPHRLVLQVGYLGTKGTRLDTQRLPNRAAPGSPLTAEERRAIANATGFTFETSDANSIYHAARVTLIRRFSRGTSFNIDYLFAKSIDDASTFGGGLAQNDLDISAERSLSNFDRRHTLNARYVLTSPFGHNAKMWAQHGVANKFLEDWTLSGGVTAESGTPLNPRVAGNQTDSAGTGANGTTRPDATGIAADSGSGYFNTAAFALPLAGYFGNAGRNTIPGPAMVVLNASFGRGFGLGERRLMEFRFDGTNVLNNVNLASIGTTLNSTNYGLPLAAGAMRSLSITLRFRF